MGNLNLPQDKPSYQLPEPNLSDESNAPRQPLNSGSSPALNAGLYSMSANGTHKLAAETLKAKSAPALMEYAR